jgi:hypothetical protein
MNFLCEILCIMSYTKVIKSGNFGDLNIHNEMVSLGARTPTFNIPHR